MHFVCGCGNWMHTEGIAEQVTPEGSTMWFVRTECRKCGTRAGIDLPTDEALACVDRLMWTDEALHRLDRMPPYLAPLMRNDVESYARSQQQRVITYDLITQARNGGVVTWDADAERRLERVPAPVRAMAKIELERTAIERGESCVTAALMEEVKARYFGMGAART